MNERKRMKCLYQKTKSDFFTNEKGGKLCLFFQTKNINIWENLAKTCILNLNIGIMLKSGIFSIQIQKM